MTKPLTEEQKEQKRASAKEWKKANPDKVRAKSKAWREANPDKVRAKSKAWYAANREKARAWSKAWYAANPEKVRAYAKEWKKANPEKVRAYAKEWKKANPEKARDRRLMRDHGMTFADKQAIYEHQGGLCGLCREAFPIGETVVDHCHLSDVRRGLLCNGCNTGEGNTPKSIQALDAWIARLKLWRSGELRPASILDSI